MNTKMRFALRKYRCLVMEIDESDDCRANMNLRVEPRFQVRSLAKMTRLNDPGRELGCQLLDISATEVNLLADESLDADEIVSIENDLHLVLAEVRRSVPRGSKFTIGMERVHTLPKLNVAMEKTRIEKIQTLIDDFQFQLGEGASAPGPSARKALAQIERLETFFGKRESGAPGPIAPSFDARIPGPLIQMLNQAPAANGDAIQNDPPPELSRRDENIRRILEGLGKVRKNS